MNKEIFSFSRIGNFENCQYGYYLTYVEKNRGENNVYGILGGVLHEIMEKLEHNLITNDEGIKIWNKEVDYLDVMGELNFPTENAKNSYIEDVVLYLRSFVPIDFKGKEVAAEKYFEMKLVDDYMFRGYIDLCSIDHIKKEIQIYDYKTSSKSGFSGKKLIQKCYQLILYAIALQEEYPEYVITKTCFDMVKYAKHKETGKIKERKDIMPYDEDEYERYFLEIPFNEENKDKFIEHIKSNIKLINYSKETEKWEFNNKNKFFCINLCSHGSTCKYNK